MYEWEKSEEFYLEKFQGLQYNHLLNSSTVEGVYETKTPLLFRAITELGCMVKPKGGVIPRNEQALGRTYKVHELEVKSSGDQGYLPSTAYEKLYLLHSSSGARHFFGLFQLVNRELTFFVINPISKAAQQVQNLKPVFTQTAP